MLSSYILLQQASDLGGPLNRKRKCRITNPFTLQHALLGDGEQNPSTEPLAETYPNTQGLTNQQEDQFIARAAEALIKANVLADLYVSYHSHSRRLQGVTATCSLSGTSRVVFFCILKRASRVCRAWPNESLNSTFPRVRK